MKRAIMNLSEIITQNKFKNIKDIIIQDSFKKTPPARWKIEKELKAYRKHKAFKSKIYLNIDKVLIDGYTTYIAACELGLKEVPAEYKKITIIEAHHPETPKSFYMWKLADSMEWEPLHMSDVVKAETYKGAQEVVVDYVYRNSIYPSLEDCKLKNVVEIVRCADD